MNKRTRKLARNLSGILIVLGIWTIASAAVSSSLVLPGVAEVLVSLFALAKKASFWLAVSGSLIRVTEAFLVSLIMGTMSGILSAILPAFDDVLAPSLTVIRATPVLALILIAMFWLPTGAVPIFAAFLMAFPVVHTSARAGVLSLDPELLEMAKVFKVPFGVQVFRLRLPAARRHMLAGARNALGLCWKVVVAGEVLAQPRHALGTGLQDYRLSLDTAGVFAWAITTVLICGLSEFALSHFVRETGGTDTGDRA